MYVKTFFTFWYGRLYFSQPKRRWRAMKSDFSRCCASNQHFTLTVSRSTFSGKWGKRWQRNFSQNCFKNTYKRRYGCDTKTRVEPSFFHKKKLFSLSLSLSIQDMFARSPSLCPRNFVEKRFSMPNVRRSRLQRLKWLYFPPNIAANVHITELG